MNRSDQYFIMLIGIPASGKSTITKKLLRQYPNSVVHSSDAIRKEISGDENDQLCSAEAFSLMKERTIKDLVAGKTVIYDATNRLAKFRKNDLDWIIRNTERKNILPTPRIIKKAVMISVDLETALERNRKRNRVVPDFVIENQYNTLERPSYSEGWDEIEIINNN